MNDAFKGVVAMIAACIVWGLSPLFYKLLAHVPPLEVLSHRTLWSLMFFGCVLLAQRRLSEVWALLKSAHALVMVTFAAVMISANWFIFILSIQIERAVESSLGYYIFPLVAVLLGMVVFKEKLTIWKWTSVLLATLAVMVLIYGLGAAPWISLAIALTFGLYGVVKKRTQAGPVVSVTAEVLVLAPLAVLWLLGVHYLGLAGLVDRPGGVFGHDWQASYLLVLSGPLTAGPLILFSYASRRITMASLGLVQYLNPTLQFFCAVAIFGELFTRWHAIAFALIWLALAIYSVQAVRQERASRNASVRVSTSGTTVR